MKRILTIILLLFGLISNAQLGGTDTAHFIDRTNQWFTTNPYIVTGAANFKLARTLFHPSQYAAASLPTGSNGSIIWDTDSLRLRYYNGTDWVLITPDGGGGVAGVTSFNTRTGAVTLLAADVTGVGGFVNGGNTFAANSTIGNASNHNLTILTNNANRIVITNAGAISMPDGSLTVGGTTVGTINLQNASASTRGSFDLSGNNPRINSATGTQLFAQAGNTTGLYNNVGWFLGGGTTPSGFILGLLAGTTSVAPLRLFSGPLTTTAVAGNIEFLTDKFYGTITTGAARKEFALWDAAGTSGRVAFGTTNGRLLDDGAFLWDNTNKRLGIGAASPDFSLSVINNAAAQLSLEHTEGSILTTLRTDANGILGVVPSGRYVSTPTGSTSNIGYVPNVIWNSITVATTSGTSESDLYSYTTPASTLGADGEWLEYEVSGLFDPASSGAGATKTLKFYWAGTEIFNETSTSGNVTPFTATIRILRVSSTQARAFVIVHSSGIVLGNLGNPVFTTVTTTFTNTNIIKVTGTTTNASDEVDARIGLLKWHPAALPGA